MQFNNGEIVTHKLTGDKLIVVKVESGRVYVRKMNYEIITVSPEELQKET